MRRHPLLGTTCLTMAALAGSHAAADVTAADVWASYTSFYEATGAEVIGELQVSDDTTTVGGNALVYRFPFNVATVRVDLPDMILTEQSDGTVTLGYAETFDVTVTVDIPEEGTGSGTLSITQTGYSGVASGDPGAVTFAQSADSLQMEISELNIPGEEVDLVMQVATGGYTATSTVTEGDLIAVTSDMTLASGEVAYVMSSPDGFVSSNTGTFGASQNSSEMALPAGGSDLMNLSNALQAGAFLRGSTQSEGNTTEAVVTVDNEIFQEQTTTSAGSNIAYSIDSAGLDITGEALETNFSMLMPDLFPFPMEGSIGGADIRYKLPLLPSEDVQEVAFKLGLSELAISDGLWDLFDPAGELPRDPATIIIDLAGTVLSEIDWLNIATLEGQLDQPVPPIAPETVTINNLTVTAVGASATASGAFTLDMTDMETIPGFPRPTGDAILEVSGANTLLDRLSTLGFIGPDEANMARFGMGFIARSTGDDSFETVLEATEDGQILVNGQRMR